MVSTLSKTWGLYSRIPDPARIILSITPFVLLIVVYLFASHLRHLENPNDKILPTISQMASAVYEASMVPEKRTGHYMMLSDTIASLKRIGIGVALAASLGLVMGVSMGLYPMMRALSLPLITFISIIPPLSLLPILFVAIGVDEFAKSALIFIGTFPLITRDIHHAVEQIPSEQITKAMTLGVPQYSIAYAIVLPQMLPRLINSVRLCLGPAWLFLIAAEAIASTDGLGYRIFLLRRYLAMDLIIPYVLWITIIGFSFDWLLKKVIAWEYSWYLVSAR